jgi:hypothetical protein
MDIVTGRNAKPADGRLTLGIRLTLFSSHAYSLGRNAKLLPTPRHLLL